MGRGGKNKGLNNGKQQNNGGNNNSKGKRCSYCKKTGHIALECFTNPNSKEFKGKNGKNQENNNGKNKCGNCGFNNHTTAECTKPKKKPNRPCKHCNSPDHYDNACPTLARNQGQNKNQGQNHYQNHFQNTYNSSTPFPKLNPMFNAPCEHCGGEHYSTQCPNRGPPKSNFIPQTYPFNSDPINSYNSTERHPLYNAFGQPAYEKLYDEWNEDWNQKPLHIPQHIQGGGAGHWQQQAQWQQQQQTRGYFGRRDAVPHAKGLEDRDGDVIMENGYTYEPHLHSPMSYW